MASIHSHAGAQRSACVKEEQPERRCLDFPRGRPRSWVCFDFDDSVLVDRGTLKTSSCSWSGVDGGSIRAGLVAFIPFRANIKRGAIRQFRRPVETVPFGFEYSSSDENTFEFHLSLGTTTGHSAQK